MLKIRWGLAVVLAMGAGAVLALGTSLAGAARGPAGANVTIRLSGPATTAVGANVNYTLTVRNWGPQHARGVVVRDRLPAGATFVSATPTRGSCSGTTVVVCSHGALPRGAAARVTVVALAPTAGRIVNQASVRAVSRDRARWNNQSSLVTIVGSAADLGLALRAAPRPATVGQPLTYTLTVQNRSSVAATNVVVTDRLPVRSTFVSATATQGTCTGTGPVSCALGTLAAGATAEITVVVQPMTRGYITTRASVTGAEADPFRANNSRWATVFVRPAA
jgi:uncharacterized repeat protein (TIGR01451 family)